MKTQLSKPARSKAIYTDEYKEQALQLWRASGRSAAKVAVELGIRPPAALPVGTCRAIACDLTARAEAPPHGRATGGGDPPLARRERQAPGAA